MTTLIKHAIWLGFLTTIMVFIGSCSDNSTGPDGSDDSGSATLTITGDFEAERTGFADFYASPELSGGMYYWQISIHDFAPQTFDLAIMRIDFNEIERPSVGTYEISEQIPNPFSDDDEIIFFADYTHIVDEDFNNTTGYSTSLICPEFSAGGELNITSSSNSEISGNFEFSAHHIEYDSEGNCVLESSITVSGQFTANPRVSAKYKGSV